MLTLCMCANRWARLRPPCREGNSLETLRRDRLEQIEVDPVVESAKGHGRRLRTGLQCAAT